MKPIIFCLIDDDEDDREIFQIAVEGLDYPAKCLTYENCLTAIETFKEKKILPDFIFLDLNMPQMHGRECLSVLKSDSELKQIPVYIFSTSSFPRDIDVTSKMGAKGFITKPGKISELQKIIDELSHNIIIKS